MGFRSAHPGTGTGLRWAVLAALSAAAAGAGTTAWAQPAGTAFSYQGRLTDAGTAVNGSFDLQCAMFSAAAGGTPIGPTVALSDVAVTNGLFTVALDFGAGVFAGNARYLEIGLRPGASTGAYTMLGARQELRPAPHAMYSQTGTWSGIGGKPAGFADDVDNDSGGDITGVTVGTGLTGGGASGAVSIGLDFAAVALNHNHFGQTWNGAQPSGLLINNSAANGAAVRGAATAGGGVGVFGISDSSVGFGVDGNNAAGAGAAVGVRGLTGSTVGRGVYGLALATTGTPIGVRGESAATAGVGVEGVSTNTGRGFGVRGQVQGSAGFGVHGWVNTSAGTASSSAAGVYGQSERGGYGVFGEAPFTGASVGVGGHSAASSGFGVRGTSDHVTDATGVYGLIINPSGRAIWGRAAGGGTAGWFDGPVNVVGTLSKSAGSFRIDHPLDPENRYLSHSFVESPDMMNVYNGNVTTDGDGFATVALPEWFEALNRDFRYQLTVLEEDDAAGFVQVRIARKIAGNRFSIRTSAPHTEVSWQVTGVRRDTYAEKHRIPVEEWKPERERGRYIHPADWGLPEERGIDWEREQAASAIPVPEPGPATPFEK